MRHELRLPDLQLGEMPIVASMWLVDVGSLVTEGDRLLEVLAGGVTVDLPSPASGLLAETFVVEDEPLRTGQILGIVVSTPSTVA